jgi:hypothetical protein
VNTCYSFELKFQSGTIQNWHATKARFLQRSGVGSQRKGFILWTQHQSADVCR